MIQRIQSLYLLVVSALGVLGFFVPAFSWYLNQPHIIQLTSAGWIPDAVVDPSVSALPEIWITPLLGCGIFVSLLPLVAIVLFKNRPLQITFCRINVFVEIVLLGMIGMAFFQTSNFISPDATMSFGFSAIFPVIAVILLVLAMRAIQKDENLVRSVDRLR